MTSNTTTGAGQARRRPAAAASLTPAAQDAPARYRAGAGDDHDRAFSDAVADPDAVALACNNWREEVAFAEHFVGAATDLNVTWPYTGRGGHQRQVSLRELLVHMIEEYAAISATLTSCESGSTAGWDCELVAQLPRHCAERQRAAAQLDRMDVIDSAQLDRMDVIDSAGCYRRVAS